MTNRFRRRQGRPAVYMECLTDCETLGPRVPCPGSEHALEMK